MDISSVFHKFKGTDTLKCRRRGCLFVVIWVIMIPSWPDTRIRWVDGVDLRALNSLEHFNSDFLDERNPTKN